MRRRFTVPLYTDNPGHLDVIEHIVQFPSSDRGKELALLVQVGYKMLYGRGSEGASQAASVAMDENQRLHDILMRYINSGMPNQSSPSPAYPESSSGYSSESIPRQESQFPVDRSEEGSQSKEGGGGRSGPSRSREGKRVPLSEQKENKAGRNSSDLSGGPKPASKNNKTPAESSEDDELIDHDPEIEQVDIDMDEDEDVADPMSIIGGS